MKRFQKRSLLSLTLLMVGACAAPEDRPATAGSSKADGYALGYFLPKGRAAASYSQRLVRCPTEDQDILVEAHAQILAKPVPDYSRFYRIDARAGFLAKRSTDVSLNADGTIKSINATVEGQGGAVLVSTLKLAAFGASLATGVPMFSGKGPSSVLGEKTLKTRCRPHVARLVDDRNRTAQTIWQFEVKQAEAGLTSQEIAELDHQRDRLSEIDDALTLSSDPQLIDPAADGAVRVRHLEYSSWFEFSDPADISKLPGNDGILLSWSVNAAARAALTAGAYIPPEDVAGMSSAPTVSLFYRRPVPVAISMVPCRSEPSRQSVASVKDDATPGPCVEDHRPEAAPLATDASAGFPQLSGLFRLPIGRGGMFGSRSVAAEFDESGAPISLSYGSEPGAADIAASIDAAREAATTLRDAPAEARARELAKLQARKDIRDLQKALDEQP